MAEETNVITLFDEEGNEIPFEHLDTLEMNSKTYIVLLEVLPDGKENDEVVIFRIEEDEEGNDNLVVIEDEKELEAAFDEFMFRQEDSEE